MRASDPLRVEDAQRLQDPARVPPASAAPAWRSSPPTPKPAQSTPGPTPPADAPTRCGPAVAPMAAISTSPSRPMPRSISTTVVASVFEPAARAVSAMRMTSPPMLLGRKLLKKVATRNDAVRRLNGKPHVLGAEQQAPAPRRCRGPSRGRDRARQRARRPRPCRATRPQPRHVDAREEQPQQPEADGGLEDGNERRARAARRAVSIVTSLKANRSTMQQSHPSAVPLNSRKRRDLR